jgi:hypothetical protein
MADSGKCLFGFFSEVFTIQPSLPQSIGRSSQNVFRATVLTFALNLFTLKAIGNPIRKAIDSTIPSLMNQ